MDMHFGDFFDANFRTFAATGDLQVIDLIVKIHHLNPF